MCLSNAIKYFFIMAVDFSDQKNIEECKKLGIEYMACEKLYEDIKEYVGKMLGKVLEDTRMDSRYGSMWSLAIVEVPGENSAELFFADH